MQILSKYSLEELEINVGDNTRIFSFEKDRTLKKGIYKVNIQGGKINFFKNKIILSGKQILFRSEYPFTILSSENQKNITRTYKGELEFYLENRKILLVLKIPLEEYVSSATYSELGVLLYDPFSSEEAKKELITAQEITIRTYVLNERKRHSDTRFNFCDLTHCMNFKGYTDKLSLKPNQYLKGSAPVNGYFHSTCGGILTGPEVYWSNQSISPHYKRGLDGEEPNCKNSTQFNWETHFSSFDLGKILEEENIVSIKPELLDKRVKSLVYQNDREEKKTISISRFSSKVGKLLGWNKIKSNLFTIEQVDNGFLFKGRGFGHGIGLCQWGAKYLADNGKSAQEILKFYFPETFISN